MTLERIIDLAITRPPRSWGVRIDDEAIQSWANQLSDHIFETPGFDYPGVPDWEGEHWVRLAVLGTSVLACLWPPEGEAMWGFNVGNQHLQDAPAIWASFARDFPAGIDLETMTEIDSERLFRGEGVLQLLDRRQEVLRSAATTILDRYDGSALRLVHEVEGNGPRLAKLLIETTPGFHDRVETDMGILPFDKLAYLAVAVIAARTPEITGLDEFPVYPDYMLPVVLRHHGVLVYEEDLALMVDQRDEIPTGHRHELAIRWATVSAAAELHRALRSIGNPVTVPQLDYHLWSTAVLGPQATKMGEHHRTVSMRY